MTDLDDDLAEIGLTESDVNLTLRVQIAEGFAPITQGFSAEVRPSPIHGNGAFSVANRSAGSCALVVRYDRQITREGAAVNHSRQPNCEIAHVPGGNLHLIALRDIDAGEELTHDYRIATWRPEK